MKFNKEKYVKLTTERAKRTPSIKNCACAFSVGGGICAIGELIYYALNSLLKFTEKDSSLYVCIVLIGASAVLTCLGRFDDIAKHAGAGTLLPITGFANAVVSPAIDTRAEGYIMGVGAKIFTVAGPVLLYGTLSGVAYGMIYWISTLL
jgi:stage V sporulation protein AC